ncbi:MAG: insulinase family protein [Spirochaetales bacterium]|nr:insulinase family protein [Spirochaetales bacterium]
MSPTGNILRYEPAPGAVLLVDVMPGSSGAALGLWFPVGSALEREDERGLTHFLEHMLFKGAGDLDADTLSRTVDREGGYLNAFTERETMCIHCLIPAGKAEMAASLLLDMAFRPRLVADEFEREKDIIVNEILASEDDLEEAGHNLFHALCYPEHGAGRPIAGTVADVRSASLDALKAFHGERVMSGRVVMTVAGNVDPDSLAALFSSRTGGAPRSDAVSSGPAAFRRSRVTASAPGSQVYIFTGLPIIPQPAEDEFWLLDLIDSAYGESMSSRLFMRLREAEGLCYSISSEFAPSAVAGTWGVLASTSPEQLPRFASAYKREAELLYRHGLAEREVSEARSRIQGLISLASDDPEYRMKRLARRYLFDGSADSVPDMVGRYLNDRTLSLERVNHCIQARLDPDNEAILMYGKITKRAAKAAAETFACEPWEGSIDG